MVSPVPDVPRDEAAIRVIERQAFDCWPAGEVETLGDWHLRANHGVTNRAKAMKFLDHWGLRKSKSGKYGADYRCVDGTEVNVRAHNARQLPTPIQAGSTVREVIWGVKKKS